MGSLLTKACGVVIPFSCNIASKHPSEERESLISDQLHMFDKKMCIFLHYLGVTGSNITIDSIELTLEYLPQPFNSRRHINLQLDNHSQVSMGYV